MSLVNQMLKDLEQRNSGKSASPLDNLGVTHTTRTRVWWPYLSLLLLVSIVFLFIFADHNTLLSNQPPELQTTLNTPASVIKTDPVTDIAAFEVVNEQQKIKLPDVTNTVPTPVLDNLTDISTASQEIKTQQKIPAIDTTVKNIATNTPDDTTGDSKRFVKQVRQKTAFELAEELYTRAARQFQAGQFQQAITLLEQAMNTDKTHQASFELYASILLQSGQSDTALSFLDKCIHDFPGNLNFPKLQSRNYLNQNNTEQALTVLLSSYTDQVQDREYISTMAALFQKTQQHVEAIKHYRTILNQEPNNGIWWIGLAISLQATEQYKDSLVAYQNARSSNHLNNELNQYVENQILILLGKV